MSKARRARIDILVEILNLASKGGTKTQIMYGANLNSRMAIDYVGALARKGCMFVALVTDNPPKYFLTDAGHEFHQELVRIQRHVTDMFSELSDRRVWASFNRGLETRSPSP